MRTFRIGSSEDRKSVTLEVDGSWLRVTKEKADGTTKVEFREFPGPNHAYRAGQEAARKLIANGYQEQTTRPDRDPEPVGTARAEPARRPGAARAAAPSQVPVLSLLEEAGEGDADAVDSPLPRMAPAVDPGPKRKPARKKKKKRRKSGRGGDELDKRVIAGIAAVGILFVGVAGFLAYAAFLKPPTIVGHWEGSRTEHEIGKFISNVEYRLILDDRGRASMAMGEAGAGRGTYTFAGDRLTISLKDEDGEASSLAYKADLGRSTLDLYDEGGKKVVQLIRFRKAPVVGGGGKSTPAAPANIAAGEADRGLDERLASVPFGPKDGAFRLRHPGGWEVDTGARPDNTYSWVKVIKGPAKVRIYADIAGSLMAGPNMGDHPEGSETAPVHGAHLRYGKDAAELYSNYSESRPATFKGSGLGEGRIATFKATEGAVFGTEVRGIRVTLLTNDRRVSVLCDAPAREFDRLLPTFLATCRSLAR